MVTEGGTMMVRALQQPRHPDRTTHRQRTMHRGEDGEDQEEEEGELSPLVVPCVAHAHPPPSYR